MRTSWYRLASSWRRLAAGYLALLLVIGLGGGLALGSVAAARRTASSFSVFLTSTNPSDLLIEPAGGPPVDQATDRRLVAAISRFPHVRHVESYVALGTSFSKPGSHKLKDFSSSVILVGSLDGMLVDQDRFAVTQGRRADPADPRQVMMTEAAAQALGVHVGQSFDVSTRVPGGSGSGRAYPVTLTGIGLLNREVVQDQIQRFPTYVVATPALTRSAFTSSPLAYFGVRLDGAPGAAAEVERRWNATEDYFTDFRVAAQTVQEADQAIRPEALALGAFGCIAGLVTVLIALEELARQRRNRAEELGIMRSLGASPAITIADGLIGTVGAIVVGAFVAGAVAVSLSPIAPIGPARPVYPGAGFAADWTVIGLGVLALAVLLVTAAITGAVLRAPHRLGALHERVPRAGVTDAIVRSGLPPSPATGVRFALDSGRGANRGSTRWVLAGAIVALLVVSATLTFANSLQTLVSQPSLYGWNWDYAVQSSDGYGPVPQATVQAVARHDRSVAQSGFTFVTLQLDGMEVPTLLAARHAPVGPPILAGHALMEKNQIVLGAGTLAQLHKRIGDVVSMRYAATFPRVAIRLRIVGVATMPAVGIAEGLHSSLGVGAVVPVDNGQVTEQLGPAGYSGCSGWNLVVLRGSGGAGSERAHRAANRLATAASQVLGKEPASNPTCVGDQASVLGVQRPAQIVNYRSMGLTPLLLAVALAAGATVALGLTLVASVRRRRRELAILKAIGFTPVQLQWSVLWQAGVVAVVGIVVGLPLGIALGRWLWTLFAEEIGAVPAPAVPLWSITVASLVAFALAIGLSAIPGRLAARTPALSALSAE